MSNISHEKQVRLVLSILRATNYSHPLILATCKNLDISPKDLRPKKLEDFADKKSSPEVHELRFAHFESRRQLRLDQLITAILKDRSNLLRLLEKSDLNEISTLSPSRSEKTCNTKALDTSVQLISAEDLWEQKCELQKKKFERTIKVLENAKQLKDEEEAKREKISKASNEKQKKIQENKIVFEEKRLKKLSEIQSRRTEVLSKKNEGSETGYENRRAFLIRSTLRTRLTEKDSGVSLTCEDEDIEIKLESIKKKLDDSHDRAKELLIKKAASGELKKKKFVNVLEKKRNLIYEDEQKALEKLGAISSSIEKSRVSFKQIKREERFNHTAEKINESRKLKLQRIQEEQKKGEEKILGKEKEQEHREILREKIREQTRGRVAQQSMMVSELNNLKKLDQLENFMKKQETIMLNKEKVFNKHRNHEKLLEALKMKEKQYLKLKVNIEAEIAIKKEHVQHSRESPVLKRTHELTKKGESRVPEQDTVNI